MQKATFYPALRSCWCAPARPLAAGIAGAWPGTASVADNQVTLTYNFKQDGGKPTGTVIGQRATRGARPYSQD